MKRIDLSIGSLRAAYLDGELGVRDVIEHVRARIQEHESNPIWITVLDDQQLQVYLENLQGESPDTKPLYGIPFAIKDNIDLADVPTTAACAEYAYTPATSAFVVQRLIDAGAIPVGKTNLDQFATGLVGTRSPYGIVRNAFNESFIAGGSSSGSAVAVALGQVSFSLGTDTAGSGRVPAAFNNIVGLKPTRGRLSTSGVVPACRSLDCVNVFALNPDDTETVFSVVDSYDAEDSYAREKQVSTKVFHEPLSIGVPQPGQLAFFGNEEYRECFKVLIASLRQPGHDIVEINFDPFKQAADMLYQGPWVAERYAAIEAFIESHAEALHPVTRQIIEPAKNYDAVTSFKYQYALQALKRQADTILEEVDLICMPTAGTHYRIEEIEKEAISYNSNLGYYTNFMNLLDYAALAIPGGFTRSKMPFGITLFSAAHTDAQLLEAAGQLLPDGLARTGATDFGWQPQATQVTVNYIDVAVCGAHLSGMPLNHQLTDKKAILLASTKTAPCYRLYALAGGPPYRPGLILDKQNGTAIEVEVWRMPLHRFGDFMLGIPHPLGIGTVLLEDGKAVNGFICEAYAIDDAADISGFGSWRKYMASL